MLHSQYWNFIWEWRIHSRTAAMGFPLRDEIMGGYPRRIENTFQTRSKSHIFSFRMELPFRFILNFSECIGGLVQEMCMFPMISSHKGRSQVVRVPMVLIFPRWAPVLQKCERATMGYILGRWVVRSHMNSFIAEQPHVRSRLISAHTKMKLALYKEVSRRPVRVSGRSVRVSRRPVRVSGRPVVNNSVRITYRRSGCL